MALVLRLVSDIVATNNKQISSKSRVDHRLPPLLFLAVAQPDLEVAWC